MKIKVSKIDAARNQLETAIKLFFDEGDFISIHTLARASHEILEALGKKQGHNSILEEGYAKFIHKDKIGTVKKKINEAKNFFKHGSRDADESIEFLPDFSTYFIWDAGRMHQILTKSLTKEMAIYQVWFSIKNPDILSPDQQKNMAAINFTDMFDINNKKQFYRDMSSGYDSLKQLGKL